MVQQKTLSSYDPATLSAISLFLLLSESGLLFLDVAPSGLSDALHSFYAFLLFLFSFFFHFLLSFEVGLPSGLECHSSSSTIQSSFFLSINGLKFKFVIDKVFGFPMFFPINELVVQH